MSSEKQKKHRVYTRTGDAGQTGLAGGKRVGKDSPRIAAYGEVDELNAVVGLAITSCADAELLGMLRRIQPWLFVVGSDLAAPGENARARRIREEETKILEGWIDNLEDGMPPLQRFILPGGCPAAAWLHLARTVCRRAERLVVALASGGEPVGETLRFLNRLSDLFFVMARAANHRAGVADVEWKPEEGEGSGIRGQGSGDKKRKTE